MSSARTLPVWSLASDPTAYFAPTPPSEAQDVIVVGAGVAGLTTALLCAQRGRHVLVIDRGGIGQGESLRTTAHLASALDDRYYALAELHGEHGARMAAASHAEAIDWIEDFVAASADRCGFRRVPGYLFAHDGNPERLRKEADAAAAAGLGAEFLDGGIPGLPQLGAAVRFDDQARIDMGRFLDALADAAHAQGVRFCLGEATAVDGGAQTRVTLVSGQVLHANTTVIASNVPFHERVAIHTKQAPYRSYVVAGPIAADALPDALIWDDGDPYHYVRLTEDREHGGMLAIIGGEDHKTGQSDDPQAFVRLQQWADTLLPGVTRYTHGWSGQILEPSDGLAYIGADPGGEDNVYVVTGDSGNGVTHGVVAGLLLSDLLEGRDNPWHALYDPRRKSLRGGSEWLRENANVAVQYRDWIAPGQASGVAELARGEGAVLRRGLHRVAVYRNGEGALHAFNARCPHMGCAVRWSPQEKSWDCPCHGSRFAADSGAVLNGPASTALAPFPWPQDE
ncbi:FAD-dependent oxidoreductase [Xanthomonas sp. WHRI 7945]|nr:FAD-dependent oxidoreductase [Xanthomonas campestris pv. campestris]